MNAIEFYNKLKINYPSLYDVYVNSGWINLITKTVLIFNEDYILSSDLDLNSYDSLYEFIVFHEDKILFELL